MLVSEASHISVLLDEAIDLLNVKKEGIYLDATFGAGGYSKAILEKGAYRLLAIDRDQTTKKFADLLQEKFGEHFIYYNTDFAHLDSSLKIYGIKSLDGAIYDLGISSMQLENEGRGFSFLKDEALDMRMDQSQPLSAYQVINNYSESQLADIIYKFGDEKYSRAIARAIIARRKDNSIKTTGELRNIIIEGIGRKYNDSIDPSTRTFQAIRIEVNNELEQIKLSLHKVSQYIKLGGRIAVVSFHSGEDRIVKEMFSMLCGKTQVEYDPIFGTKYTKEGPLYKKINNKVIMPSEVEVKRNIKSRSAKLRVIERIL